MKKYVMVAVTFALAAAGGAWAGLGSVISSFNIPPPNSEGDTHGVYCEGGYVYFVSDNHTYPYTTRKSYTLKYTPAGSFVSSTPLNFSVSFQNFGPSACDASHLGAGYFFVSGGYLTDGSGVYRMDTGALVQEFYMIIDDTCWEGAYYYFAPDSTGKVPRLTPAGEQSYIQLNGWPAYGGIGAAYATAVGGVNGHYLVSSVYAYGGSSTGYYANLDNLDVVGSFPLPYGYFNIGYGPGYPPSYGTTLWASYTGMTGPALCYQIDLGNGNLERLAPASFGKIKAIYR